MDPPLLLAGLICIVFIVIPAVVLAVIHLNLFSRLAHFARSRPLWAGLAGLPDLSYLRPQRLFLLQEHRHRFHTNQGADTNQRAGAEPHATGRENYSNRLGYCSPAANASGQ